MHANIEMFRGTSKALRVKLNKAGEEIGFSEGDRVYFTVKRDKSLPDEKASLQIIVSDFSEGRAIINIAPSLTRSLKAMTYYYDIKVILKSSYEGIPISGNLELRKDVTHAGY